MPNTQPGDEVFEAHEQAFFAAGEAHEPEPAVTSDELRAWVGDESKPPRRPRQSLRQARGEERARPASAGRLMGAARFLRVAALWALCLAPSYGRRLGQRTMQLGRLTIRAVFASGEHIAAGWRRLVRTLQVTAVGRLSPRRLAAMIRRGEWLPLPWLPLSLQRPWLAVIALALLLSTIGSVWAAAVLAATGLG
jgi:hypothetical protein